MSRESDKLMLKLPMPDVAAWLRAELKERLEANTGFRAEGLTLRYLIAKLGADETDIKGDNDER